MANQPDPQDLPELIQQYITNLAKRIRNRHMRRDVVAELSAHFADALTEAPKDVDRDELAASLIADFGDAKTLRLLIKRAKKRCRPLWVKFVIRTCQSILILLLIFVAYSVWFLTGKATISVDYLARLNEMVRPDADESLNAAPYYLKATELLVIPDDSDPVLSDIYHYYTPGCPLNPDERQALLKWLQSNQSALDQVRAGASKPFYWIHYKLYPDIADKLRDSSLVGIDRSCYSKLRMFSYLLRWQMQFAAEAGDWNLFTSDLKAAKTLARHLLECPLWLEQYEGLDIDGQVNASVTQVLQNHNVPGPVLRTIAQTYQSEFPLLNMAVEELFLMDLIQTLFTDDGSGDGHLIPDDQARFLLVPQEYWFPEKPITVDTMFESVMRITSKEDAFDSTIKTVMVCMTHPSRRQTVSAFRQVYKIIADSIPKTPYQLHLQGQSHKSLLEEVKAQYPKNLLLKGLASPSSKGVQMSYLGLVRHQAAQTVVALLRYKAKHGQFPQTLDELVPQYLQAIPDDPFGPGSLTYKRQGDDFILYSWGLNFKDHGGQHDRDVFITTKPEGDYVFWPPEPVKRPD